MKVNFKMKLNLILSKEFYHTNVDYDYNLT